MSIKEGIPSYDRLVAIHIAYPKHTAIICNEACTVRSVYGSYDDLIMELWQRFDQSTTAMIWVEEHDAGVVGLG